MKEFRFKTFNYKYNRYLPCELVKKLSDAIWLIDEYIYKDDDSYEIIQTATFIKYIENI